MARDSKLFEEAYKAYKVHSYFPKKKWKPPKNNWGKTKSLTKQQNRYRKKAIQSKPFYLYVLELEDGCYYVGCTRWPDKRLANHMAGTGALWTQKHKPIRRIELVNTFITNKRTVQLMEDQLTIKYAEKYGADFVRGGGYCQTKPRWPRAVYDACKDECHFVAADIQTEEEVAWELHQRLRED